MYLAGYGLQKSVFAIIVQSLPHDDVDEEAEMQKVGDTGDISLLFFSWC